MIEHGAVAAPFLGADRFPAQRLHAGVDHHLAWHGVADHRGEHGQGAVFPGTGAHGIGIAIVEHVRARSDFRQAGDVMHPEGGWRRASADDLWPQAGGIEGFKDVLEVAAEDVDQPFLLIDGLADVPWIEAEPAISQPGLTPNGTSQPDGIIGIGDAHPLHAEVDFDQHIDRLVTLATGGPQRFDGDVGVERHAQLHIFGEGQHAADLGAKRGMRQEDAVGDLAHDLQLARRGHGQADGAEPHLFGGDTRRLVGLDVRAQVELVQRGVGGHPIQIHREAIKIDERDRCLDVSESIGHIR